MNRDVKIKKILKTISSFLIFFLFVAFVLTCCMMLFLSVLSHAAGLELTGENITVAAKLTLVNAVLLSFLLWGADAIRRKITVGRSVKQITQAAAKIIEGDFSVRIDKMNSWATGNEFGDIAEYFNKMAEELAGTETLRSDFIANVSHELKTPLAVIKNYGTLLQQPGLDEEKRLEYAKAVTDAAGRLANLITNILKLNKLENQQIAPKAEEYDLSAQVCECLLGFEDAWEKKGLDIETDIEDGVIIRSDAEMMSLVWNNLFSNAVKFTPEGGKISLTVKTEGDCAVVEISDTGCGISREVGQHMFDKFYQGDNSHATEGNGLGLALVKRVVDLAGCDISVESEVGKGTAFTLKMRRVTL